MVTPTSKRKKVNFMIGEDTLVKLQMWFSPGERSNFVDRLIRDALTDIARKKASESIDEFRKKSHWKMTDEEIRKAREYDRK